MSFASSRIALREMCNMSCRCRNRCDWNSGNHQWCGNHDETKRTPAEGVNRYTLNTALLTAIAVTLWSPTRGSTMYCACLFRFVSFSDNSKPSSFEHSTQSNGLQVNEVPQYCCFILAWKEVGRFQHTCVNTLKSDPLTRTPGLFKVALWSHPVHRNGYPYYLKNKISVSLEFKALRVDCIHAGFQQTLIVIWQTDTHLHSLVFGGVVPSFFHPWTSTDSIIQPKICTNYVEFKLKGTFCHKVPVWISWQFEMMTTHTTSFLSPATRTPQRSLRIRSLCSKKQWASEVKVAIRGPWSTKKWPSRSSNHSAIQRKKPKQTAKI